MKFARILTVVTLLFSFFFVMCDQVRTFKGHTNEKNFVGLTVNSEYIACGSETNDVFVYHKVSELKHICSPVFHGPTFQ